VPRIRAVQNSSVTESVFVYVFVCERESVYVYVCVSEREREVESKYA